MAAQSLLKAGLRKTIGSGTETKVWQHPWLPSSSPRPPRSLIPDIDPDLKVNNLLLPNSRTWNLAVLQNLVVPEDVPLICSIRPRARNLHDGFCWCYTISGAYSVKSGHELAMKLKQDTEATAEPSTKWLKTKVWKVKTSSKIKHFLWQSLSDCLPVCDRLVERHCGRDRSCPRCGANRETTNHLLFECPRQSRRGLSQIYLSFRESSRAHRFSATSTIYSGEQKSRMSLNLYFSKRLGSYGIYGRLAMKSLRK